jgi:hypothetical protein
LRYGQQTPHRPGCPAPTGSGCAAGRLLRGDDIGTVVEAVAPADIPGWFTPDVAVLELAMSGLELASVPGSEPLQYEGLRERYLPEVEFRGRVEHRNSQYALYAAACMRGGLQPDLLNDAGWWQTRLWIYAVYAAVIYSRAAADRRGTALEQVAHDLAARHGLVEDLDVRVLSEDSSAGSRHYRRSTTVKESDNLTS